MKWFFCFLILCLYTPFSGSIDLYFTRYFFVDGEFSHHPFFTFLYDYGERPSQIVAALSLFSFLIWPKKCGRSALYLFLTLAIGAFLINEVALKKQWGRPRPKQVVEFGGNQPFRPYYSPNFAQPEPSRSFPCGHCTAGFYFFCLAFLGKRKGNTKLYLLGLSLSLLLGVSLGVARIAQGGHFFSDVLFGACVMYLTAKTLDRWMFVYERPFETAA